MNQAEIEQNLDSTKDDQIDTLHLNDVRKPHLTLKHLNKLRKMRELRRFEKMQQDEFHAIMYGTPAEEANPLG
jgi:hypothetical protein